MLQDGGLFKPPEEWRDATHPKNELPRYKIEGGGDGVVDYRCVHGWRSSNLVRCDCGGVSGAQDG